MTTYFVTRHKGAAEWARGQGIKADHLAHLDPEMIDKGDTVLGTLPVTIAAEICTRGARYFHLSLIVPEEMRGRELTVDEMDTLGAKLEEYEVRRAE